jgi:hypothetical protein
MFGSLALRRTRKSKEFSDLGRGLSAGHCSLIDWEGTDWTMEQRDDGFGEVRDNENKHCLHWGTIVSLNIPITFFDLELWQGLCDEFFVIVKC